MSESGHSPGDQEGLSTNTRRKNPYAIPEPGDRVGRLFDPSQSNISSRHSADPNPGGVDIIERQADPSGADSANLGFQSIPETTIPASRPSPTRRNNPYAIPEPGDRVGRLVDPSQSLESEHNRIDSLRREINSMDESRGTGGHKLVETERLLPIETDLQSIGFIRETRSLVELRATLQEALMPPEVDRFHYIVRGLPVPEQDTTPQPFAYKTVDGEERLSHGYERFRICVTSGGKLYKVLEIDDDCGALTVVPANIMSTLVIGDSKKIKLGASDIEVWKCDDGFPNDATARIELAVEQMDSAELAKIQELAKEVSVAIDTFVLLTTDGGYSRHIFGKQNPEIEKDTQGAHYSCELKGDQRGMNVYYDIKPYSREDIAYFRIGLISATTPDIEARLAERVDDISKASIGFSFGFESAVSDHAGRRNTISYSFLGVSPEYVGRGGRFDDLIQRMILAIRKYDSVAINLITDKLVSNKEQYLVGNNKLRVPESVSGVNRKKYTSPPDVGDLISFELKDRPREDLGGITTESGRRLVKRNTGTTTTGYSLKSCLDNAQTKRRSAKTETIASPAESKDEPKSEDAEPSTGLGRWWKRVRGGNSK